MRSDDSVVVILTILRTILLRRIFGPKKDEVTGNGGDCITRS